MLPAEFAFLESLPANSEKVVRANRAWRQLRKHQKRLSITLNRPLARKLSQVIQTKRIDRDRFFHHLIGFLVNGDPKGSCIGPLAKIRALIDNPRHEYYGGNPYEALHSE